MGKDVWERVVGAGLVPEQNQEEAEDDPKAKKKTRKGESKAMAPRSDIMKKFEDSLINSYRVTYPDGRSDPIKYILD